MIHGFLKDCLREGRQQTDGEERFHGVKQNATFSMLIMDHQKDICP
jgi:hypothetical protein